MVAAREGTLLQREEQLYSRQVRMRMQMQMQMQMQCRAGQAKAVQIMMD